MIKLASLLKEVAIEDISIPFYFKSKKGIQGMNKDATFLIKDIPSYGNIKVYYYDGRLPRFFWMYKSHLQQNLDNKDFVETNKTEYKPLKEVSIKVGKNGESINGYDVEYFKTARGVYANIEIPSQNPTFDDDTQIKGFGKDEKDAFNDLKKEFEKYLKKKK